jgi:hypothetical protein
VAFKASSAHLCIQPCTGRREHGTTTRSGVALKRHRKPNTRDTQQPISSTHLLAELQHTLQRFVRLLTPVCRVEPQDDVPIEAIDDLAGEGCFCMSVASGARLCKDLSLPGTAQAGTHRHTSSLPPNAELWSCPCSITFVGVLWALRHRSHGMHETLPGAVAHCIDVTQRYRVCREARDSCPCNA